MGTKLKLFQLKIKIENPCKIYYICENMETKRCSGISNKLQISRRHVFIWQVKDIYEARDFLGVSMGTILKIKAGSLTPDDPTRQVLRRSRERAPHTVEIMLQITRETVRKQLHVPLMRERTKL